MKVSEITSILAQAALPALSRDQLLELAGTEAGKRFQAVLVAFGAGDRHQRDELEATVHVLAPALRATLRRLGSTATVDQLVTTACREQWRFFDAIDAIAQQTPRAAGARQYLAEQGTIPTAQTTRSIPVAPPYYSFKVFGTAAALCIAEAQTQATSQHTVNIEGALALAGAGPRTFDWPNKIVVQLTVQEAYQVLGLFENRIRSLKFDGHGRAHDKSLGIEFQESHYFVRLIQRGRPAVAVPVRPVDAIPIISLLYKQLLRNEPHLRIEDIRCMVERMAEMTALKR
ncbi:hypothetical protein [Herbaspirillum sp. SJZ107]|uniref:hypothetical protein n=1 Tax=Herbaspirillum sp. SJZ107 TaxID=2572881 RepID=UPI00115209E2|nr:hypothetical protein [Herbaspirillum sp. SJZ107]TQK01253.1 hypothetical protein FBX97_5782 [Herbaspirillum sp. SJZ107]